MCQWSSWWWWFGIRKRAPARKRGIFPTITGGGGAAAPLPPRLGTALKFALINLYAHTWECHVKTLRPLSAEHVNNREENVYISGFTEPIVLTLVLEDSREIALTLGGWNRILSGLIFKESSVHPNSARDTQCVMNQPVSHCARRRAIWLTVYPCLPLTDPKR